MLVLVAIVIAFVIFRAVNRDDPPDPVQTVDYVKVADYARDQAPFSLLAPTRLPTGWRATTVNYLDGARPRWHVGLLTDRDRYVGLEQSTSSAGSMVETYVDEAAVAGDPVTVGDATWETWTDEGGDLAFVREDGDTTTLVVGHQVPQAELVGFASSLR